MASSAWSVLVDVELDTSTIKKQLDNAGKKYNVNLSSKKAREEFAALSKSVEDSLLTFNVANEIFRTSIDLISSMASEVYELDASLTEMKKVSDLSGASLENYVNQLGELGSQVARTKSEMVDASTEFIKSGFTEEEAATLGLVSAMYQNIADEAITASDSANFIIAQLTAFNMTAEDSYKVIDAVNEV